MRVGPQYQANVPDYDPGKWDLTHLIIFKAGYKSW